MDNLLERRIDAEGASALSAGPGAVEAAWRSTGGIETGETPGGDPGRGAAGDEGDAIVRPRHVSVDRDPLWVRWGRRLLSLPTWGTAFVLLVVTSPLLFAGAAIDDLIRRRFMMPRVRCVAFFLLYLGAECVGVLFALVNFVRAGMPFTAPTPRLVELDAALQRGWTSTLFHGACALFGMKTHFEGTEHARKGPFLLFVRHASKIDTVLSAVAVANPNGILLRYVLKHELLWDPCLDVVGNVLPNTFVRRGKNSARDEIEAVRALARNLGPADGVLIYPEGTCFEPRKFAASIAKLREKASPALVERAERMRHVLPPRLGGPLALIDEAPHLDIVICAHTGLEAAVDFTSILHGDLVGQTIDVRIERFPASSLPEDEQARAEWLYDRWLDVDAWVDATRSRRALQKTEGNP